MKGEGITTKAQRHKDTKERTDRRQPRERRVLTPFDLNRNSRFPSVFSCKSRPSLCLCAFVVPLLLFVTLRRWIQSSLVVVFLFRVVVVRVLAVPLQALGHDRDLAPLRRRLDEDRQRRVPTRAMKDGRL